MFAGEGGIVSVQFGRWNFDGKPIDHNDLGRIQAVLAPCGPDGNGCYSKDNVGIVYHAFHTTKESRRETQPHVSVSGAVLAWDGRLDNRAEMISQLGHAVTCDSTDVSVVAAAYEEWGTGAFARLIGDWAVSMWDPNTRSLVLAKDPIGTRHLYYAVGENQVTWSTILDPLVLFSEKTFSLCEEYIAGWFSFFPAPDLTPYVGIRAVPPSCSVVIRSARHVVAKKYWDFDPAKAVRYSSDGEYEEHFRSVFTDALRCRLRSDTPILAELSGGMDSSSIVCMADTLIAQGAAETSRLDTLSYFDDAEPNWNERPYFTAIEKKRDRTGCHIDVGKQASFVVEAAYDNFVATPFSGNRTNEPGRQFADCIAVQGNRVILSGVGGDEVTGGVPASAPELADLFAGARFGVLAQQLKAWALNQRRPWFHLFLEAVRGFFPVALSGAPECAGPAPWIDSDFAGRNRAALCGYPTRTKLFGSAPSFQANISTLDALRRQLAATALPFMPPYEKRYPYLDRSLLEFMYAIPREQVVRPGHRRSLMRRALTGIVPDEILNRRRKAYVTRAQLASTSTEWDALIEMTRHMVSGVLGIVDCKKFSEALQKAQHGQEVPLVTLRRTLGVEAWLKTLRNHVTVGDGLPAMNTAAPLTTTMDLS